MEDHWFDALNKALVKEQPRRTLLNSAVLLANLAVPLSAMAKKGKGKGKGKGHGKNKDKNKKRKGNDPLKDCHIPNEPPCSGAACRKVWAGCSPYNTQQRDYCEFICEQCNAPGNGPFCIVGGYIASCCDEGLVCCGGFCAQLGTKEHCGGCDPCPSGWECCHGSCIESETRVCCARPGPPHDCPFPSTFCCTLDNGLPGCCPLD